LRRRGPGGDDGDQGCQRSRWQRARNRSKRTMQLVCARVRARVRGSYWRAGMMVASDQTSPSRRKGRRLCGAKTRAGGCCQVRAEPGSARCRFHGDAGWSCAYRRVLAPALARLSREGSNGQTHVRAKANAWTALILRYLAGVCRRTQIEDPHPTTLRMKGSHQVLPDKAAAARNERLRHGVRPASARPSTG
jgi:hypothetical protein